MQAILNYIISVINSLVDILSIQLFPDFPVTVFQFLCYVVEITYIFKIIFGGTREFDSFANISIKDVSRSMNNNDRKIQVVNNKKNVSTWVYKEIKPQPLSDSEKNEMISIIHEFD